MQPIQHIAIDADTCSGQPRVAGTRIRVSNIVLWTEQGRSPDEIVAGYPQLTLADVHAALAYYFDNRDEMDRLIEEDSRFVEGMRPFAVVHEA
jgi:uncharacterized protein (DUF433 family)